MPNTVKYSVQLTPLRKNIFHPYSIKVNQCIMQKHDSHIEEMHQNESVRSTHPQGVPPFPAQHQHASPFLNRPLNCNFTPTCNFIFSAHISCPTSPCS